MMHASGSLILLITIVSLVFEPIPCICWRFLKPVINQDVIKSAARPLLCDFTWAEKTRFILRLFRDGKERFFFARPRYFGKTVFLRILQAVFEGRREIFAGTDIYKNSDYMWEDYPVMYFDFSDQSPDTVLREELTRFKRREGVDAIPAECVSRQAKKSTEELVGAFRSSEELEVPPVVQQFRELLCAIKKNDPQKRSTVVLVDGYDRPILRNLKNRIVMEQTTNILTRLFKTIETSPQLIHFAFVTGTTRYSFDTTVGDFKDISDDPDYAEMAGLTEGELKDHFQPRIDKVAKSRGVSRKVVEHELKEWFGGHTFTSGMESLYNPKSVVRYLQRGIARWIQITRSALLWHHLQRRPEVFRAVKEGVRSNLRCENDILSADPETMLHETGFFTIIGIEHGHSKPYILGFANDEVRYAFFVDLLRAAVKNSSDILFEIVHMKEAIHKPVPDFNAFASAAATAMRKLCGRFDDEKSYRALFWVLVADCDLIHLERPKTKIEDTEMDIVGETASTHLVFRLQYEREGSGWHNRSLPYFSARDGKNELVATMNLERLHSRAPEPQKLTDSVVSSWRGELRTAGGCVIRAYSNEDSRWLPKWMNHRIRKPER